MGRRNGRNISGWLIVDKPAGMTSTSVVGKVRWAYDARKTGHAGTLDPAATGVLAVALGEATKTVPYVADAMKGYRFAVNFGTATNTDDAEGETIARSRERPSDEELARALRGFTGDIMQTPPQFSAVKVDGVRAYKRARDGDVMELAPRPLRVESLELLERPDPDSAVLEMVCGKGGYVRSIARDLGEALGCLGHAAQLRRFRSDPFDESDCVEFREIERLARTPEADALLLPLESGLASIPEARCAPESASRLRHGNPAAVLTTEAEYGEEAWASCQGHAVAVGVYRGGELHPTRVFNVAGSPA